MKLPSSSFSAPAPSPHHASNRSQLDRSSRLSWVCAVLLLAASLAGPLHHAGAAPKAKPTPTPTPTVTPTPTPTPTPAPTATPAATTTPDPAATPNYNGTQQAQYIATAREAFVALRTMKSQPFLDAHAQLDAAGSMAAKGLKTREDIAARRDLVAKTIATNDAYLEFVRTQQDTYRAELAKTPLIPNEIETLVKQFDEKANTATTVKLREIERDALKAGDDMLAALNKKFGSWTVNDAGKVTFKKSSDVSAMNALSKKYNAKVTELMAIRQELAPPTPSPSPAASPGATPAANPTGAPGTDPVASPSAKVPAAPGATAKP